MVVFVGSVCARGRMYLLVHSPLWRNDRPRSDRRELGSAALDRTYATSGNPNADLRPTDARVSSLQHKGRAGPADRRMHRAADVRGSAPRGALRTAPSWLCGRAPSQLVGCRGAQRTTISGALASGSRCLHLFLLPGRLRIGRPLHLCVWLGRCLLLLLLGRRHRRLGRCRCRNPGFGPVHVSHSATAGARARALCAPRAGPRVVPDQLLALVSLVLLGPEFFVDLALLFCASGHRGGSAQADDCSAVRIHCLRSQAVGSCSACACARLVPAE